MVRRASLVVRYTHHPEQRRRAHHWIGASNSFDVAHDPELAEGHPERAKASRRITLVQRAEDHGVYSVDEWTVRPSEARTNKSDKGPRTSVRGDPVDKKGILIKALSCNTRLLLFLANKYFILFIRGF